MKWGIANVKAKVGVDNASPYYYGLTPPTDTTKLWIRTSATPTSEKTQYLLPLNVDINELDIQTLVDNNNDIALGNPCIFSYKNYIYVVGGNASGNSTNAIRRYNLETNILEILETTFPVVIARTTPVVMGDYAYFVGGYKIVNSVATTYYSIYKLNLKTLEATLEITDNNNITLEMYDIFKYDDETIIWNMNSSAKVVSYNVKTQIITYIGSKNITNGVNMGSQNKFGCYSSYGYNNTKLSVNVLSLGIPTGQATKTYVYNGSTYSLRYGLGSFAIGRNVFMIGGIRGSAYVDIIEKVNVDKKGANENVDVLPNITIPTGAYVAINFNENMGIVFVSSYLYLYTYKFALNENESILETDGNGNVINCYIGNSNNKAELFRVYKYNALTEKWEGVNCQDYAIE